MVIGAAQYDPVRLVAALDAARAAQGDWSAPSTIDGNGVHHGYSRMSVITNGFHWPSAEPFKWVLVNFEPVRSAFLSQLDPGGYIVAHRDGAPWYERWHVPIVAAGTFTEEDRTFEPQVGVPFQVHHWQCHALDNQTADPRVSLVIDRDVTVNRPHAGFAKCEEQ